jgi:hypothetical protein
MLFDSMINKVLCEDCAFLDIYYLIWHIGISVSEELDSSIVRVILTTMCILSKTCLMVLK